MQHLTTFKIAFLLLFASSFLLLNYCIKGKGDIVEQLLTVSEDFKGVKAMGKFNVVVFLGQSKTVIAKGNQNIINKLITDVNNDGILELKLEPGNYLDFDLTVYISIPTASYFGTTSEGDLTLVQ
jgi:hypothetical protein